MEPIILEGKYTSAKIFAKTIEEGVIKQTLMLCNHPIFEDAPIRIMPDCHEGAGCTIGFTCPLPKNGEIIPNIIGVDQSCGMLTVKLNSKFEEPNESDLEKLDQVIRKYIPYGENGRPTIHPMLKKVPWLTDSVEKLDRDCLQREAQADLRKIGSLGSGNHFISIEKGDTGTYLIIHSGSRNFGNRMALYFQELAEEKHLYGDGIQKSLSFLDGEDAERYKFNAQVCNEYSKLNRLVMATEILDKMEWTVSAMNETIHNYIAPDNIIRKGAISCYKDEIVLIPLNMRDGSLICKGVGNSEWNNSGPHGAGRILSRSKAKAQLSMEEYENSMKGIFTTCISKSTLDEAPMAYKDGVEIQDMIHSTAEVIDHLKPIYNFKG